MLTAKIINDAKRNINDILANCDNIPCAECIFYKRGIGCIPFVFYECVKTCQENGYSVEVRNENS